MVSLALVPHMMSYIGPVMDCHFIQFYSHLVPSVPGTGYDDHDQDKQTAVDKYMKIHYMAKSMWMPEYHTHMRVFCHKLRSIHLYSMSLYAIELQFSFTGN